MIFRYPGGKSKISKDIVDLLAPFLKKNEIFAEPFVGGGSVAIKIAELYPNIKIILNDKNENIYSFWKSLLLEDDELEFLYSLINQKPTVELFNKLRKISPKNDIEKAYYAIFFNRCTFSGIETSGPIGGYNQNGKWKIDCRYDSKKIIQKIKYLKKIFNERLKVTNLDFKDFILKFNKNCCFYLDPPYFEKGKHLYKIYMNINEHKTLNEILQNIDNWVLSYDANEFIKNIYNKNYILEKNMKYSINGMKKEWTNKKEFIILKNCLNF